MGTKSNRSSGTQINARGVTQGTTLVDPITGLPVGVIKDSEGNYRLAVDAKITAQIGELEVNLDSDKDAVAIEDPDTGAHIKVELDGSTNVNCEIAADDGDSILSVGTQDGTLNGTQRVQKIDTNGDLHTVDTIGNAVVASIDSRVTSTNTKLDTLHSDLLVVEGKQDSGNSSLVSLDAKATGTNTKLDTLHSDLLVVEGKQDTGNVSTASIDSKLTSTNTKLDTLHSDLVTVQSKQDTQTTSLQLLDDTVHSINTSFNKATAIAGQLDDTTTTVATEDNIAPLRITPQRAAHVNLRTQAGVESGTASNPIRQDPTGTTSQPVVGNIADSIADSGNPIKIGGTYNAAVQSYSTGARTTLQMGPRGEVFTSLIDTPIATYSAAILNLVSVATPTDLFTIYGSASRIVRITRIRVSATQSSPGSVNIQLIKRSAANTGGTSTVLTNVSHDSLNIAGSAVVRAYTANPSALGASIGAFRVEKLSIPGIGSGGATGLNGFVDWDFGHLTQNIVLRGIAQGVAINLNSISVGGSSFCIWIEWREE